MPEIYKHGQYHGIAFLGGIGREKPSVLLAPLPILPSHDFISASLMELEKRGVMGAGPLADPLFLFLNETRQV